MKKAVRKQALLLSMILALLLIASACSQTPAAAPVAAEADTPAEPVVFDLSGKEETVEGQTFDGDVVITGDNGRVLFLNCTFNARIIHNGGEGAKVMVWSDCRFAGGAGCIIDSALEEATMDTDLPKLMFFCDMPNVVCERCGAVVTTAEQAIRMNGTDYAIGTAEYYMNETTGEFGDYAAQEVTMHNLARWVENGEPVQMHVAVFTAD